jgi:hypothetical protein
MEFLNGQPYAIYQDEKFSVHYPDWQIIDTSQMPESEKIKISVNNGNCSFFVKVKTIESGLTLDDYAKKVISGLGDSITVDVSEVQEHEAKLDATIDMGNGGIMRNVSRVFRIGDVLYSIVFVAPKADFSLICEPVMAETIGSVRVK